MITRCLVCGAIAESMLEEIEHMQSKHPEVVDARLREAGFEKHPITGEWVDTQASDD